jgi:hypothetical protein
MQDERSVALTTGDLKLWTFFFLWLYSPLWTLASLIILPQMFLSPAFFHHVSTFNNFTSFKTLSIHPMALQPKSGLGLLYLLPPQCSIISGQLPVATAQKSGSILLYHIFSSFPGLSNWSYSFKLSFKHFLRNSCAFHPLDMSCPLKPFQFDTCYKVRFAMQFIQFLVVSKPPLTVILNWTIDSP